VNENGGSILITVTRTGGSSGAVGVSYATSNGTAIAGSDYTATSGTLNWTNGDNSNKTFSVPVLDDSTYEGNETVNLAISNPTGGATLGSPSTAVLTILDDDPSYSVTLNSPADGAVFSSCFLIAGYQPSFSWTANGTFKTFSILFSTSPTNFKTPIVKVDISGVKNGWIPPILTWKTIMGSSNHNGTIRDIYWKIVGTKPNGGKIKSGVRGLRIDLPQGIMIQSPIDGDVLPSGTPPTFVFDTDCNKKFRLEISPFADFSKPLKIIGFVYTVKDPNIETTLQKTLSAVQWSAVESLIGTKTGYFRIKAWDGIRRRTISEKRSFTVQ
jgi:hypothetical protein